MNRPTPDRSYRIDAAARLRLQPGVDPDALEQLLQYFRAESRASHVEMLIVALLAALAALIGGILMIPLNDVCRRPMRPRPNER